MSSANYSVQIQENIVAVTAANAVGELTFATNLGLHPGTLGWLTKNDGSLSYRVRIVKLVGSTKAMVRRMPGDDERKACEGTGYTDVSAFNTTSSLCVEAQLAQVSQSYVNREVF